MFEIDKHIQYKGIYGTVWRGRNADGYKIYVVTTDRHGVSIEPKQAHTTLKVRAIEDWQKWVLLSYF